jgi:hypothetical protein
MKTIKTMPSLGNVIIAQQESFQVTTAVLASVPSVTNVRPGNIQLWARPGARIVTQAQQVVQGVVNVTICLIVFEVNGQQAGMNQLRNLARDVWPTRIQVIGVFFILREL